MERNKNHCNDSINLRENMQRRKISLLDQSEKESIILIHRYLKTRQNRNKKRGLKTK